jgi:hypothetical protein
METHWKRTIKGTGETLKASLDPVLSSRLSSVGTLVEGGYRYVLLNNGKLIFRTREIVKY